jgi:SNF2 family DNA or RNA helicase
MATMLINNVPLDEIHPFTPGVNEVARLAERLAPIMLVRTKAECLDLPEQIFRPYWIIPSEELKSGARLLLDTAQNAITALTLSRELSDGFQYERTIEQTAYCVCGGKVSTCPHCHGSGVIQREERILHEFPTGKDEALCDLLDEFDDDGRIIVYAGFQASVDRCVRLCAGKGWDWVRLDGRGFSSSLNLKSVDEAMECFQNRTNGKQIAWIGHPKSGGMGLTLTASQVTVYFSNSFDLEDRLQSKDRNYRIGTRGSLIIDLFQLPSDKVVTDRLDAKQRLQSMTMGQLKEAWNEVDSTIPSDIRTRLAVV